ncbi:hypothetical protein GW17_00049885 [Ensete ventricosum]|nr:hypothetical protein GW17_00049885 [Ensete ventricosum]
MPKGEMESPVNPVMVEVMGTRSLSVRPTLLELFLRIDEFLLHLVQALVHKAPLRSEGVVESKERVSSSGRLGVLVADGGLSAMVSGGPEGSSGEGCGPSTSSRRGIRGRPS